MTFPVYSTHLKLNLWICVKGFEKPQLSTRLLDLEQLFHLVLHRRPELKVNRSVLNFINILQAAFLSIIFQQKITTLFKLRKAIIKMLMTKLTPIDNFNNILQASYVLISFCHKNISKNCKYKKATGKILMILI
jgi:hypothetical protein